MCECGLLVVMRRLLRAKELGQPLSSVRRELTALAASRQIITCVLTRFDDGKPVEAWQCRVSGYVPPAAPGRKAKAAATA